MEKNGFLIRPVQKSDNKALASIIRSIFIELDAPRTGTVFSDPTTDSLYELFNEKEKSILYVAERNGIIYGCSGIFPTEGLPNKYAELVKLYLAPESRNKGIGKTLFEIAIETAREMDYTHLYIESQPSFGKAVKMYEKYGFIYLDHALGNSGHDNCDVWMIKKL